MTINLTAAHCYQTLLQHNLSKLNLIKTRGHVYVSLPSHNTTALPPHFPC